MDATGRRKRLERARSRWLITDGREPFPSTVNPTLPASPCEDRANSFLNDTALAEATQGLPPGDKIKHPLNPDIASSLAFPLLNPIEVAIACYSPYRKNRVIAAAISHSKVARDVIAAGRQRLPRLEPVTLEERAFIRLRLLLVKRRPLTRANRFLDA